jgi:alcohol dehydrogenase
MQLFQQQYRIIGSFGAAIRNVGDGLQKMAIGLTPTIDSEVALGDFGHCLDRLRARDAFGKLVIRIAA